MQRAKRAFRKGIKFYFIYVFIFAIVMFAVQKPREKEQTDINQIGYENLEGVNKDRVVWHMQNYYDEIWNYENSSSLKNKMKSKHKIAGDKFNQNLKITI